MDTGTDLVVTVSSRQATREPARDLEDINCRERSPRRRLPAGRMAMCRAFSMLWTKNYRLTTVVQCVSRVTNCDLQSTRRSVEVDCEVVMNLAMSFSESQGFGAATAGHVMTVIRGCAVCRADSSTGRV